MKHYGLRLRHLQEFAESNVMHSEIFLKWTLDREGFKAHQSNLRFSRVRASGEIWSLPLEGVPFSDDRIHWEHTPKLRFERDSLGFLKLVPL